MNKMLQNGAYVKYLQSLQYTVRNGSCDKKPKIQAKCTTSI